MAIDEKSSSKEHTKSLIENEATNTTIGSRYLTFLSKEELKGLVCKLVKENKELDMKYSYSEKSLEICKINLNYLNS